MKHRKNKIKKEKYLMYETKKKKTFLLTLSKLISKINKITIE